MWVVNNLIDSIHLNEMVNKRETIQLMMYYHKVVYFKKSLCEYFWTTYRSYLF